MAYIEGGSRHFIHSSLFLWLPQFTRARNDLAATMLFRPVSFAEAFRGNHFPNICTEIYFDRDRALECAFLRSERSEKSIGSPANLRTYSSRCTPTTIPASFRSVLSPERGAFELSTRELASGGGNRGKRGARRRWNTRNGTVRVRSSAEQREQLIVTSRCRGRPTERRGRMRTKVHL